MLTFALISARPGRAAFFSGLSFGTSASQMIDASTLPSFTALIVSVTVPSITGCRASIFFQYSPLESPSRVSLPIAVMSGLAWPILTPGLRKSSHVIASAALGKSLRKTATAFMVARW